MVFLEAARPGIHKAALRAAATKRENGLHLLIYDQNQVYLVLIKPHFWVYIRLSDPIVGFLRSSQTPARDWPKVEIRNSKLGSLLSPVSCLLSVVCCLLSVVCGLWSSSPL